jgi:hypothetical protein
MTKDQYIKETDEIKRLEGIINSKKELSDPDKKNLSALNAQKNKLREEYIEANKPCNIGDKVSIKDFYNRNLAGEVVSFGILEEKQVCIISYQATSGMKYLSRPHKSVQVIK